MGNNRGEIRDPPSKVLHSLASIGRTSPFVINGHRVYTHTYRGLDGELENNSLKSAGRGPDSYFLLNQQAFQK